MQKSVDDFCNINLSFTKKIEPFLKGLYIYYFRCHIVGWENLPKQKLLFVGNHNGLLTFEVLMLFYAWWKRFGGSRNLLALAHGIAVNNPLCRWLVAPLGAIPANPKIALQALERGYSLLVYPGGEKESCRPYSKRKKVDFYQRKGFIRLALKAKVPIVPIVSVGAHESYVILNRGEFLAHLLGLKKKFRLHALPVTLRSLFFLLCFIGGAFMISPFFLIPISFIFIFIPMPAKMHFKILPPIDIAKMLDAELNEEENFQKIYDYVVFKMQSAMTDQYCKRKFPVIG